MLTTAWTRSNLNASLPPSPLLHFCFWASQVGLILKKHSCPVLHVTGRQRIVPCWFHDFSSNITQKSHPKLKPVCFYGFVQGHSANFHSLPSCYIHCCTSQHFLVSIGTENNVPKWHELLFSGCCPPSRWGVELIRLPPCLLDVQTLKNWATFGNLSEV